MDIVIMLDKGKTKATIIAKCNNKKFVEYYGANKIEIKTNNMYEELCKIASFVNNNLNEGCYFAME